MCIVAVTGSASIERYELIDSSRTWFAERCSSCPDAVQTRQVQVADEIEASVAVIFGLIAVLECVVAHNSLVDVRWSAAA